MSTNAEYLKRIMAREATHNKEYSFSVASSLLSLAHRYRVNSSISQEIDNATRNNFERIHGFIDGRPLTEVYTLGRGQMFEILRLAQEDEYYKPYTKLIHRLQEKLPRVFPEEMETRAYHWETMEGVLSNGKEERRIFPLHYVFILLWCALHDNASYIHNYEDNSLSAAEKDLPNRLLTFFKALDENIENGICAHGVRNALVLCLNKIHPDVDLIEDVETSLNVEFRRLLCERLSARLDDLSEDRPDSELQKALLDWIQDDNGTLAALRQLLQLDEKPLFAFLQHHGIQSHPKVSSISHYQPLELEMPKHQYLVAALHAVHYLTTEQALQKVQSGTVSADLNSLCMQVNNPQLQLLCDKSWQERLIVAQKLHQLITIFNTQYRILPLLGIYSQEECSVHAATAQRYFAECVSADTVNFKEMMDFAVANYNRIEKAMNDSAKQFIENFFAVWTQAFTDRDLRMREPLYQFILAPENKALITLTDEQLQRLGQTGTEGEVDVTPYEINRIFLHALTTPVEEWSLLFSNFFEKTLELMEHSSNKALKLSSYPAPLRVQLHALLKIQKHEVVDKLATDFLWHPNLSLPMQNIGQLVYILNTIPQAQYVLFFTRIQYQLPQLIPSVSELAFILRYSSPEGIRILFSLVDEQLNGLINSLNDLRIILKPLNQQQMAALHQCMLLKLLTLIKNVEGLGQLFRSFAPEKIAIFCAAMPKLVLEFLKNTKGLVLILHGLDSEQKLALLNEGMKEVLSTLVNTVDDFCEIAECLDSTQLLLFCSVMGERLPVIVKTAENFCKISGRLDYEQKGIFYSFMSKNFPDIVETVKDFCMILKDLIPEYKESFCACMQKKLLALVKNIGDVAMILRCLDSVQIKKFCASNQELLSTHFKTENDLRMVKSFLNSEQGGALSAAVEEQRILNQRSQFSQATKHVFFSEKANNIDTSSEDEDLYHDKPRRV